MIDSPWPWCFFKATGFITGRDDFQPAGGRDWSLQEKDSSEACCVSQWRLEHHLPSCPPAISQWPGRCEALGLRRGQFESLAYRLKALELKADYKSTVCPQPVPAASATPTVLTHQRMMPFSCSRFLCSKVASSLIPSMETS